MEIQVTNVNEFSPEFVNLPYEYHAEENAGKGTSIGHVVARDADGDEITYSLSNGDSGMLLQMPIFQLCHIVGSCYFFRFRFCLIIRFSSDFENHDAVTSFTSAIMKHYCFTDVGMRSNVRETQCMLVCMKTQAKYNG